MRFVERRQTFRIALEEPLKTTIRSIGSKIKYNVETKNLSNSGTRIIKKKDSQQDWKFTENSMLEVWITLNEKTGEEIFFNAKILWNIEDKGDMIYGLKIIQINKREEDILIRFIQSLREQFGEELANTAKAS